MGNGVSKCPKQLDRYVAKINSVVVRLHMAITRFELPFCPLIYLLNNNRCGGDLDRNSNGQLIEVVPSQYKPKRRVDKSSSEDWHCAGNREVSAHLTQRIYDTVEVETRNEVCEKC